MKNKYLEYLGLSDKEALIYLNLLRADSLSAIELSRLTDIKKATTYVVIEELVKKNLVKEVQVGKRVHFQAESPEKFRTIYENKKNDIDEQLRRVDSIIAELKSVERKSGERPIIKLYEGKIAVKDEIAEYVKQEGFSEGEDYGIYSYDLMDKLFSKKDIESMDNARIKNNVRFNAIYTGSGKYYEKNKNQQLIKIDQEQFPIACDIGVYNDEVRIHTLGKDVFGIKIKNKEIATTLKSLIKYVFAVSGNK